MKKVKEYFSILKDTANEFMEDKGLKLSAALSYYTIFALAPMLLVMISALSIFVSPETIQGELFEQIQGLVGVQAAEQLQEILKNAQRSDRSGLAAAIGVGTLIIGATGVFAEMQDSINLIWSIRVKPKKGWLKYLKTRLISFSLILTLGFLLIVSLAVNAMVELLSSRLEVYFSEVSVVVFYILNLAIVWTIITTLFAVIFKVLPDAHLRWKECIIGAGFTGVLFLIGKFAIGYYLGSSDLGATYGTSASIIILLSWVYYTAIILYFGAEFTKVYAKYDGASITPTENAVLIEDREVVVSKGKPLQA
ncbi:membrane protein [Rhabdobacter roseus]|uniref:Membrane protein n=1 Tax=Rhabdobacter roseus TaxID=1655419 RepID=A0A840TUV6_9BACT|nr:YihY/virulence factor BrkB family protein [Rhabdobacter roseus]MBB5283459.1 membrane protein [Rhabdobacter roseus]